MKNPSVEFKIPLGITTLDSIPPIYSIKQGVLWNLHLGTLEFENVYQSRTLYVIRFAVESAVSGRIFSPTSSRIIWNPGLVHHGIHLS